MSGLSFFKRDSGGGLILASYHSPDNMCWTWLLSLQRFRGEEWRWWPLVMRHNDNCTRRWTMRIWFYGFLGWQRQTNVMPYRDLYQRSRDERDRLDSELRRMARQQVPPRSPFQPTVIDGGQSVH
jgi:hypothetical protein